MTSGGAASCGPARRPATNAAGSRWSSRPAPSTPTSTTAFSPRTCPTRPADQFEMARPWWRTRRNSPAVTSASPGTKLSGVAGTASYARTHLARIRELLDPRLRAGRLRVAECTATATPRGRPRQEAPAGPPDDRTGAVPIVLDHPGPVITYSLPADSTVQADVWLARGETANNDHAAASRPELSVSVVADDDLAAGWPRLEVRPTTAGSRTGRCSTAWPGPNSPAPAPADHPRGDHPAGRTHHPGPLGASVRLRIRDGWHEGGTTPATGWSA